LRDYTPATRTWREIEPARHTAIGPFFQAATSASGEIWIAGEHGLGRLVVAREGGTYGWMEIRTGSHYSRFNFPEPGAPGELFAQASQRDGRKAILRWAGDALEEVYASADG
jgi:hypothetical protein